MRHRPPASPKVTMDEKALLNGVHEPLIFLPSLRSSVLARGHHRHHQLEGVLSGRARGDSAKGEVAHKCLGHLGGDRELARVVLLPERVHEHGHVRPRDAVFAHHGGMLARADGGRHAGLTVERRVGRARKCDGEVVVLPDLALGGGGNGRLPPREPELDLERLSRASRPRSLSKLRAHQREGAVTGGGGKLYGGDTER